MPKKSPELTAGQAAWLKHLEMCAGRGESMSAYAARKGLSLGGMYEAARTLRRKGAWPASTAAGSQKDSAFVRLNPQAPAAAAPIWRARLPNGVVIEGSGAVGADLLALFASL